MRCLLDHFTQRCFQLRFTQQRGHRFIGFQNGAEVVKPFRYFFGLTVTLAFTPGAIFSGARCPFPHFGILPVYLK